MFSMAVEYCARQDQPGEGSTPLDIARAICSSCYLPDPTLYLRVLILAYHSSTMASFYSLTLGYESRGCQKVRLSSTPRSWKYQISFISLSIDQYLIHLYIPLSLILYAKRIFSRLLSINCILQIYA